MKNKEFNFVPDKNWEEIKKEELADYGVADLGDAKVVSCFKVINNNKNISTVTLYLYGEDEGQIDEMYSDYKDLQINLKDQEELGVFPLHYEKIGKDKFLSVLKPVHNPVLILVDLFFAFGGKIYSFHTNINKDEKKLTLKDLCEKYPQIGYCYNAITKN